MGYYTPEQAERLRNQWLLQNVAGYSGGGSGGGSGGSSKGSSSSKKTKSGGKKIDVNVNNGDSENDKWSQIDMSSVLALGYGPISYERLEQLESAGQIFRREKDGRIYFYPSPSPQG